MIESWEIGVAVVGEWHSVSGISTGYEQWTIDLSDYAGTDVEVVEPDVVAAVA